MSYLNSSDNGSEFELEEITHLNFTYLSSYFNDAKKLLKEIEAFMFFFVSSVSKILVHTCARLHVMTLYIFQLSRYEYLTR